ncbi:nose resistant to fluoxetine protein 6-like [Galleria mellonella]|uniref:Nose resistant to fluoxetine protein 6-like n=1 Tax=Galleria mellonella TaxID=7137 RepID=A0A6J1X995_GALME|nr:nose resistant to fluoxetine protein 6-like [Galleria mellonella]
MGVFKRIINKKESNIIPSTRTMFTVIIFVLVSVVGASVNSTSEVSIGKSRMLWLKTLLDHHYWMEILDSTPLPKQCEADLRNYIVALNNGQLWASKIYDASGQYIPNVMFGSDFWVGSKNACRDLQLKQYYAQTPPFATNFYVAKINISLDGDHLPQGRITLVGECLPASCNSEAVAMFLASAERLAAERASEAGFAATIQTSDVRKVPGAYSLLSDYKFCTLMTVVSVIFLLMLTASLFEGYLERKYQLAAAARDLELAHNDTTQKTNNNNVPQTDEKRKEDGDNNEKGPRRETCGIWAELLLSFSVLSNGRTILSIHRASDGALTSLHGIRFLSVTWVIMVHTYLTVFYISDNKTMRVVTERNLMYQSVGNASYCVDTFFFISGLLVTVLFLRTEEKKKKRAEADKEDLNKNLNGFTNSALSVSVISQQSFKDDMLDKPKSKMCTKRELFNNIRSFFVLISYRIVRLTPAYAFVIWLTQISFTYVYNQSAFEPAIVDHLTCDAYWWRNLLYINNLYPQREICMVWSWYMANDTQFYVVGIIILLLSVKHPKFASISLGVVLVSSWVTTIYISVWHQYKARIQEPFEMFDALYDKPWSRIGPYLVGMIVGWYLHKTKCQVRIPYWLVGAGWISALAIIGSLIFGMVDGYFEVWPTAFYVSIGHSAWGAALAWVAIACCCGYGGLINSALSYRGFLPLSRLTYCAYLIHPTIMVISTFHLDGPLHLQNTMVIVTYAGYAVMAFLSSFAISISFEAPAVRLIKILSGNDRPRKRQRT